jgi:RNA polymerase sigma factor (sigma-70 family)
MMVELIRDARKAKIHFVPSAACAPPDRSFDASELREGRLLSAEEEALCFRRMNLLKRKAAELVDPAAIAAATARERHRREAQAEELLREALAIRNGIARVFLGMSIGLSRRFVTGQFALDELASEASLTLLQAIENFNADLGFRFSTYATRAIKRNLYRFVIRRRAQERREAPADGLMEAPDHRQARPIDLDGPSPADVCAIVGELRERDAYIVRRRFGLFHEGAPFTLQRVADELGVTRERVRQLESRALRRLRDLASERFAGMEQA